MAAILGVLRFSVPSKAVVRQVKLSYSCGVKLHLTLFPYVCPQLAQPLGVQQWPAAIQPCDRHKHVLPYSRKPWSDWLEYMTKRHRFQLNKIDIQPHAATVNWLSSGITSPDV